uniref:Uncharacterized protein n=1 Tax=Babesia orientalis TaxID=273649 RepID=A0A0M4MPT8_9APIC|nr:hypothetical protein [Babesia orientalis]ALE29350.1 hypothetical protein [Babesia orientalis]
MILLNILFFYLTNTKIFYF